MRASKAKAQAAARASRELAWRDHDDGDKILTSSNDLLGMFALFRFGMGVQGRLAGALAYLVCGSAAVIISARVLGGLVEAVVSRRLSDVTRLGPAFLALESLAVLV